MNKSCLRKLMKMTDKDLKILRDEYKNVQSKEDTNEKEKWLTDNFYLLEKEGRTVISALSEVSAATEDESGLPRMYSALFRLLGKGKMPSVDSIGKELQKYDFSVTEADLCELMLRAAIISKSAEGIKSNDGLFQKSITLMNEVPDMEFERICICKAEKILRQDSVFSLSDSETKAFFRKKLELLSKKDKKEQSEYLEILIRDGCDICRFLLESNKNAAKGKALLILEMTLPLVFSMIIGFWSKAYYLIALLYFPFWEIIRVFLLRLFEKMKTPVIVPRTKSDCDLLNEKKTLICVSSLLQTAEECEKVKNHLKSLYLSNCRNNIAVCMLADLKSSKTKVLPEDETDIQAAKQMTDSLNSELGSHFILLVREREFIKTQNEYSGHERKRGAIELLIKALSENLFKNQESGFQVTSGACDELSDINYVLALDSDTQTSLGCVEELLCAALHPLNKAKFQEQKGVVSSGYGIFMPLVETSVESANRTLFSRLMAGSGGLSVYSKMYAERYSAFFGGTVFTGKGLIDVSAYYKSLNLKLKQETILSHDIIEGEFLRTAYVSAAQVTDGFPAGESSYFSRLHRWTRGDIQNSAFLKMKVDFSHGKEKNPLCFVSRFKIADNIRRILTPIIAFHMIIWSVFVPPKIRLIVIATALICVAADEIYAFVRSIFNVRFRGFFSQYYGDAIAETTLLFVRIFLKISMLPQAAYTYWDALIKALWRMIVSHKKMLEWVTAAQTENRKSKGGTLHGSVISIVSFLWLLISENPLLIVIGILFAADCPFSFISALKSKEGKDKIDYLNREKLKSYVCSMWNYYADFCNEENNFLPVDNVQLSPDKKTANRTSPTNIGVMLCSVLAARDMSIITTKEMYEFLKRAFDSIIKLQRWHGNLLNWYDTKTLEALTPIYVSTVDSGNFLCCLAALSSGVAEYESEYPPLSEIRRRIDGFIENTDISVLYNKKRNLFHIGYSIDDNMLTSSYYDLLMSEARMTSFFAIASGQVPKKHWSALARTMSGINGYYGAVSWSGTMFEYFMPYMFLPSYKNTFVWETLEFCVYCQKLRTKKRHLPWGISESGYYKFDNNMNYQYKAHGVSTLALKKDPLDELVVSPYSTFLALPFCKRAAIKNLEVMEKNGFYGEYGFYEAIDYSRLRNGESEYSLVRSYMAHHIGMSIISVDNAIFENRMQKRFMAHGKMMSGNSLLMEKVPAPGITISDSEKKNDKTHYEKRENEEREFALPSVTNPNVHILSNGEWTSVISDVGAGHSVICRKNATRQSRDLINEPLGVFAFVKTKDEVLPAQRAASPESRQSFTALFDKSTARLYAKGATIEINTRVSVPETSACEIRKYTIRNKTKNEVQGTLCIYFEPSLEFFNKENAHKAFSKLFLTAEKDEKSQCVVFKRNSRDKDERSSMACGFADGRRFCCNLSRETVLKRPAGVFSLNENRDIPEQNFAKVDVCAYIEKIFKIPAKGELEFTFYITGAENDEKLYDNISEIRGDSHLLSKHSDSPFGIDDRALVMLPRLFFDLDKPHTQKQIMNSSVLGRQTLWEYGISGDKPIIYLETNVGRRAEKIQEYLNFNRKLRYCGIETDLIAAYYEKPQQSGEKSGIIKEMISAYFTKDIISSPGGVHLINLEDVPISHKRLLISCADFVVNKTGDNFLLPSVEYRPIKIKEEISNRFEHNTGIGNGYLIEKKPQLPWSYMISNPVFGTLVSDDSPGFTFALNSHENKLTSWSNDTRYGNNGERLIAKVNGEAYDIIRSSTALFGEEKAVYQGELGGVSAKTVISVAKRGMKKEVKVTLENFSNDELHIDVAYYVCPQLSDGNETVRLIKQSLSHDAAEFYNPTQTVFRGTMRLSVCGDEGETLFVTNKAKFFEGKWEDGDSEQDVTSGTAVVRKIKLPPKENCEIKFILSFARFADAAEKIAETELEPTSIENKITINTGNKSLDDIYNNFLLNQIIDVRLYARCGFYQCGGAYGFRDQLQDVSALFLLYPEIAKRQIARCAAAQFKTGDVLHWWHNNKHGKRGVRTRCSDDLLWLAYVLTEYVKASRDWGFLNTQVFFLDGEELKKGENERYDIWHFSDEKASLLVHAVRAVERAYSMGEHSLILMGGGDWNDGMNKLGEKGRGESVWLSEFAVMVFENMAFIFENINDEKSAELYKKRAADLKAAIDKHAYRDGYYIRAFDDDSNIIGGENSENCKIDILPQAFSVLCGMPDSDRRKSALRHAYSSLVDKKNGIVKLLSPAFSEKDRNVGYIAAYPGGLRENGGQYTHAAVWFAMALLKEGLENEAYEVLNIINPMKKYEDEKTAEKYKTEPYYLCGDVYSADGYEGRGGWSGYTGSASWYYQAVNAMLGIKYFDGKISVEPHLPESIKEYKAKITLGGSEITINVCENRKGVMTLDGVQCENFIADNNDHIVNLQ